MAFKPFRFSERDAVRIKKFNRAIQEAESGIASSSLTSWGDIEGDLNSQADLKTTLQGKRDVENGFTDREDSTISFDDGTRTFSIQPVGATFEFYAGKARFISPGDTVVIDDIEGLWYFYFDVLGALQATQTFSDSIITDYAFVSLAYWDATNSTAITLAEERHGTSMPSATHLYNHNTIGTRYGEGLQVGDIDPDGSGNDASNAQISVGAGTIWDEDLRIDIAAAAAPANIPILYRSGANGDWRKIAATDYITATAGSGRGAWNEYTGGAWQLSEVDHNDFFCVHLYAVNDINNGYFLIPGQAAYSTSSDARTGAQAELLAMAIDGLPVVEYKSVATFILQTASTYSNAVKSKVITTDSGASYIDWRGIDLGTIINITDALTPAWSNIVGPLYLPETVAGADTTGKAQLFVKDNAGTQELWFRDDAGVETQIV